MKAYDITKLTAKLKSDNVQYKNKIIYNNLYYCCCFLFDSVIRSCTV